MISDKGRQAGAYGLYQGDTVARDNYHDRIIIFRDTLLRDFGHDPDLLRDQVTRTVRHELAHHLGADELGVRELGSQTASRRTRASTGAGSPGGPRGSRRPARRSSAARR